MLRKVIITGPTGAVGHALIQECLDHNVEVFAVCRPNSARIGNIIKHPLVHVIEADLAQLLQAINKLPKDCDALYHLAWSGTFGALRNDMELQAKNIQYTLDAVKLAHACGCHTFIGAGSQAEYGRVDGVIRPDTPTFPENGYGMAKLCAGEMSRVVAQGYGMKHIWARIISVFGICDLPETMVMSAINKLLKGEKPLFTKGEQVWDYLYSGDAGGILFALSGEKSIDGKIYCVCSGQARPLREYIEIIRDSIDHNLPLGLGEIPYAPKQVMHLSVDNSDILNQLGYKYKYSFETGIKETIAWAKSNLRK